jgi:inner membrane protein
MPSPVGHEIAGFIAYDLFGWILRLRRSSRVLILCLLLAILPDFDFLFGMLAGDPNMYHHGMSHSVVFGFLISGGLSALFYLPHRFWIVTVIFSSAYMSHLLLDFLSLDRSAPYGMQLLWPFSDAYYVSAKPIFSDIQRVSRNMEFFQSIVTNTHNYGAVVREVLILAPPALLVRYLASRRQERGIS